MNPTPSGAVSAAFDIVCLSHLRWDFVYQRPQHLLTRFAREHRVFFVEEPIECAGAAHLDLTPREGGVVVVVPHLPPGLDEAQRDAAQRGLLNELLAVRAIDRYVL